VKDKKFKQTITLMVAAVTFAGSLVVWLNVDANARAANSSRNSRIRAIRFLTHSSRSLWKISQERQLLVAYQEIGALKKLEQAYALMMTEPEQALPYRLAQERLQAMGGALKNMGKILTPPYFLLPAEQIDFFKFYLDLYYVPAMEQLQWQELQRKEAAFWTEKSEKYTLGVTILAVAVFLLTLSMTISGRIRWLAAGTGLSLVFTVIVFCVLTLLRSYQWPPRDSIRGFSLASGRMLQALNWKLASFFDQAAQASDEALTHLHRTLNRSPDYSAALQLRAMARSNRGEALLFGSGPSAESRLELEKAIADWQAAFKQEKADGFSLWNCGYAQFLAGRYVDACRSFRQALVLLPEQRFGLGINLAVCHLFSGQRGEAEKWLAESIRHAAAHPLASDPIYFRAAIANFGRFRELFPKSGIEILEMRMKEAFVAIAYLNRSDPIACAAELSPLIFIQPQYDSQGNVKRWLERADFSLQVPRVNYLYYCRNMQAGLQLVQKVYWRGSGMVLWREQSTLAKTEIWSGPPKGKFGWTVDFPLPGAGQGLAAGDFRVELFVQGKLLSSGEFRVR